MTENTYSSKSEWITNCIALVVTIWFVFQKQLDTKDVVWGLWVSSYTAGYFLFFVQLFFAPESPFRDPDFRKEPSSFLACGIVFLFFLFIHNLIHQALLMFFLAFMPFTLGIEALSRQEGAAGEMFISLYRTFWPIIIFTSISWIQATYKETRVKDRGSLLLPMPTGYLIRLVFTVFVLGICRVISETASIDISAYIILPVLALIYLPIEKLAGDS